MTDADFETDRFLELLTDALRSGPGSPQWHDAVRKLRAGGSHDSDEYRMLVAAREHLESGEEYRAVKAGPGFSKKVMDSVKEEALSPNRGPSTTTVIAGVAAVVIVGIVIVVGMLLMKSGGGGGGGGNGGDVPAELAGIFTKPIVSSNFDSVVSGEWKNFGVLPVRAGKGLRVAKPDNRAEKRSGGIILANALVAREAFEIDATVRYDHVSDALSIQIFITDDDPAEYQKADATPNELVCWLESGVAKVIDPVKGNVGNGQKAGKEPFTTHVVIKMSRDYLIVENPDGKKVYSGPHGLSVEKPRTVGVRFVFKGGSDSATSMVVEGVKILKP